MQTTLCVNMEWVAQDVSRPCPAWLCEKNWLSTSLKLIYRHKTKNYIRVAITFVCHVVHPAMHYKHSCSTDPDWAEKWPRPLQIDKEVRTSIKAIIWKWLKQRTQMCSQFKTANHSFLSETMWHILTCKG